MIDKYTDDDQYVIIWLCEIDDTLCLYGGLYIEHCLYACAFYKELNFYIDDKNKTIDYRYYIDTYKYGYTYD